jgi:hypothetical protein
MLAGSTDFHAVPASVSKTCLVRFDTSGAVVARGAAAKPATAAASLVKRENRRFGFSPRRELVRF